MREYIEYLGGMAGVALTLAILWFGGWWLFVGQPDKTRQQEDPVYASELFEGLLPVEEILATRKWHVRGAEPWDCTFAIARLSEDMPATPPSREEGKLGWRYQFGGNWKQTPAPKLRSTTRDALAFCSKYWPRPLANELKSALSTHGAWFDRDGVGETLFIYAPKQRLAARVRFGD